MTECASARQNATHEQRDTPLSLSLPPIGISLPHASFCVKALNLPCRSDGKFRDGRMRSRPAIAMCASERVRCLCELQTQVMCCGAHNLCLQASYLASSWMVDAALRHDGVAVLQHFCTLQHPVALTKSCAEYTPAACLTPPAAWPPLGIVTAVGGAGRRFQPKLLTACTDLRPCRQQGKEKLRNLKAIPMPSGPGAAGS